MIADCAQRPQPADQHSHLRDRQAEQMRPVDQHFLGADLRFGLEVVAETIGKRLHRLKAGSIGVFLSRIAASAHEGNGHIEAGIPCCLFDRCGTGQHDGVRHAEAAAMRFDGAQHLAEFLRVIDRPRTLRLQPDARAIGAATVV